MEPVLGTQDYIAFLIVGVVVFFWMRKLFLSFFSKPIARYLLKRGKVKSAMRWNQ